MATAFKKHPSQWLLVFFCLSLNYSAKAQLTYEVNQDNLISFIQEISDDLGGIMNVSPGTLTAFLVPYIATPSTPNLRGPNVSIDNYDATSINFSWTASSSAIHRLGYLNLRTGASENQIEHQPSGSFNIPDDLYLFAFKVYDPGGPGISSITIIIFDKVIALSADPDLACDCKYQYTDVLQEGEYNFPDEEEFDLYINTGGPFNQALYKAHFKQECPTCDTYLFNPICVAPAALNQGDSPPFLITVADLPIAAVSFENAGAIHFDIEPGYQLRIGACKSKPNNSNNSNPGQQLQTKPILETALQARNLNVRGSFQTNQNYYLSVYNMTGQLLARKEQSAHQTQISEQFELSAYPAGIYILRLEGENISQNKSFVVMAQN